MVAVAMLLAMTAALQSDSEDLMVCTIIFARHIHASFDHQHQFDDALRWNHS